MNLIQSIIGEFIMKIRVLIVALIALVIAIGSNGFAYADSKNEEQRRLIEKAEKLKKELQARQQEGEQLLAVILWNRCRMVLSKRGVQAPEHGPEFFGQVKKSDIGKVMLTTAGPASADKRILAQFMFCIKKKDYDKAATIMDGGEIKWVKSGMKAELVTLLEDGIAVIRPPDAVDFIYAADWSIKPAEQ